jgi:ribonuclease VapC
MSNIVFDASAIIAIINDEVGGKEVISYLKNGVMSAVNFSESVAFLNRASLSIDEARQIIKDLLADIILFDEDQAYLAAELKSSTKKFGLSLGDCACLALAKLRNLPVITADRAWKEVDLGIKIIFLR